MDKDNSEKTIKSIGRSFLVLESKMKDISDSPKKTDIAKAGITQKSQLSACHSGFSEIKPIFTYCAPKSQKINLQSATAAGGGS